MDRMKNLTKLRLGDGARIKHEKQAFQVASRKGNLTFEAEYRRDDR